MNIRMISISELNSSLKSSSCQLSFWGDRVVTLANGDRVDLHKLSHRLFALGYDCLEKNYSIQDRLHGHQVKEKLVQFYEATDLELSKANPLTRLIFAIRSFLGLIDEGSHPSPETEVSHLDLYSRLRTFELFQGFKSDFEYQKRAFFRPIRFFSDGSKIHNEFVKDGVTVQVSYHPLSEIGKFCVF